MRLAWCQEVYYNNCEEVFRSVTLESLNRDELDVMSRCSLMSYSSVDRITSLVTIGRIEMRET